MTIIHKYLRRVIVWAQTPSQEELDNLEARRESLRRRQDRNAIIRSLRTNSVAGRWTGYGRRETELLIEDASAVALENDIPKQAVVEFLKGVAAAQSWRGGRNWEH